MVGVNHSMRVLGVAAHHRFIILLEVHNGHRYGAFQCWHDIQRGITKCITLFLGELTEFPFHDDICFLSGDSAITK
jgi:hypothetical protein